MASIVCEPCKGVKCCECVLVCPVDAFHEDHDMLVINPESCIDCGACQSQCSVAAIFDDVDVPHKWVEYIDINAKKSLICPIINQKK